MQDDDIKDETDPLTQGNTIQMRKSLTFSPFPP